MAGNYEGEDFAWIEPYDLQSDNTAVEDFHVDQHPQPEKPSRLGIKIALGILVLNGGLTVANIQMTRHTKASEALSGGCPTLSDSKIEEVRQITERPKSAFDNLVEKYGPGAQKDSPELAYRRLVYDQAKKYKFTLIDERPYKKELRESENVSDALETLNKFSGRHGFMVWADGKINFDHSRFITGSTLLMDSFRFMPVEETNAIGLKGIKIVDHFTDGPGSIVDAAAQAVSGSGVIEIEKNAFYNPNYDLYFHELGHLADYKFCGSVGYDYDPAFTNYNPGSLEYGVAAPRGSVVSDYAGKNINEDKAETYAGIVGYLNPRYFRGGSQTIRQKADLLLARLDSQVPDLAKYLSAISPHRY